MIFLKLDSKFSSGDIYSSLYSVIIAEGPLKVFKNHDPLPVECHLRLKNHDQSNDYLETVLRSMNNQYIVNSSGPFHRVTSFQWRLFFAFYSLIALAICLCLF